MLRIDVEHGDNEAAMARDMIEQAVAMLEAAGAEEITTRTELPPPGFAIHEVGTARMGNDPKTSVLTPFLQTHDVKNLFVMDGSYYVSIGCVNPTLTMMASRCGRARTSWPKRSEGALEKLLSTD